ncbi:MAG: family oxidoreductase [Gammaproteobacteria bacterium]|nr:family oxidoreductase [Gammaproteobacteria bacterium]
MTKRFADRLVLITGAAGGMGRAFALRFAEEGAGLILTDVEQQGLEETASLARAKGAQCSVHRVNLALESDISQFADQLRGAHSRLDVLVNNAGIAYGEIARGFEGLSQEKWLHYFNVNTVAPLLLAQALRPLIASARGVVLNISSMASNVPATAYGVTKAALNAMTYGMAQVFSADGIRVNAIEPGIMETPASRAHLTSETYDRVQSQQLLKLHGTADDIAALGLFLASDDARFITCEIVHCDAGNRLRGWRG